MNRWTDEKSEEEKVKDRQIEKMNRHINEQTDIEKMG
jgi:hypothetical protein